MHIHVRNPKTTKPSMDGALYREVVERIRASGTDVLINLTTGPGARFMHDENDPSKPSADSVLKSPDERVRHVVELKPDICSLDMGSLNMGDRVFVNTPDASAGHGDRDQGRRRDARARSVRDRAPAARQALPRERLREAAGHVPDLPRHLLGPAGDAGSHDLHAQPAAAGLPWFAFGISLHQFPMVAQTVLLGGHPRVGLEDNIYLEKGKLAPSNAALVEKAGKIIEVLGDHVATPADARQMLGLNGRNCELSAADDRGQSAHETVRLAEYAAALRYEDIPPTWWSAPSTASPTPSPPSSSATTCRGAGSSSPMRKRTARADAAPFSAPAARACMRRRRRWRMARSRTPSRWTILTWPSTGVHPGATLLASALALAQERGIGGRALLTGFVAGSEAMIRIGRATLHHNEERGFHAPGTTGPFGAAIACGRLMGFDAKTMTNAIGIAGSLACGLLEFARSGTGAMVKRLHLGRAAESGVLAASLAADGFTGPVSALEGEYGFLRVYCGEHDVAELTRGLGESYATRSIMLKRFACHITAHTSVQAIADLKAEHGYAADEVASIAIAGSPRMATVNNIPAPADIMMAQYSIPFCVALAHVRDPRDPRSFDDAALRDPHVRALMQRVTITVAQERPTPLAAVVTVTLKDGRVLRRSVADFKGTPQSPLDRSELRDKFLLLTRHCNDADMRAMFERLQNRTKRTGRQGT